MNGGGIMRPFLDRDGNEMDLGGGPPPPPRGILAAPPPEPAIITMPGGTSDRLRANLTGDLPPMGDPGAREAALSGGAPSLNDKNFDKATEEWATPPQAKAPPANDNGKATEAREPEAPPTRMVNVPGHTVKTASDEQQAEMTGAFEEQKAGLEQQKDAEKEAAQAGADEKSAEATGKTNEAIALANQTDETKTEADRTKSHADELLARIDHLSEEHAKAKIDPERMWKSADGFQKARWTIANVLGGFLMGYQNRSTNPFADQLHQMAKDDVDAQRADYDAAGDQIKGLQSNYAEAMKATGDRNAAYAVAQGLQLKSMQATTQGMIAQSGSAAQVARGKVLDAQLGQKIGQLSADAAATKIKMNPYVDAHTVVAGGDGLNFAQHMQLEHLKLEQRKVAAEEGHAGQAAEEKKSALVFKDPDGQEYIAKDAVSRKLLAAGSATYNDVKNGLETYKEKLAKIGAADRGATHIGYTTEDMGDATTAYNHVMSAIRKGQDDGVWKKGEAEMLAQSLTPPTHFTGNGARQSDVTLKMARQMWESNLAAEDAAPVNGRDAPKASTASSVAARGGKPL